jgi:hypothetical protein
MTYALTEVMLTLATTTIFDSNLILKISKLSMLLTNAS